MKIILWEDTLCPGQVVQLVIASSLYSKFVGLIPSQGTYKKHPMNV